MSATYPLGVAAIVRDEAPYLLEWIAWNQMIGVDHFVIVDHGSVDGTTELLEMLEQQGLVTHIRLDRAEQGPQAPAYIRVLADHGHRFEWLGFIDVDEFVVPDEGFDFKEFLLAQPRDVGGVAPNWANFGSSFQPVPDNDLMPSPTVKRFGWRGHRDWESNKHVKCFLRPEGASSFEDISVHAFVLPKGSHYVSADGVADPIPADGTGALTKRVNWSGARINHYTVRSLWEFEHRKLPRGDAMHGGNRPRTFFAHHDGNEVFDPIRPSLLEAFDEHHGRLIANMTAKGFAPPTGTMPQLPPESSGGEAAKVFYEVDRGAWCKATGKRYVEGWCFNKAGYPVITSMKLTFGPDSQQVAPEFVVAIPRPDVQTHYPQAPLMCGFRIYLPATTLGPTDPFPMYEDGEPFGVIPPELFSPAERLLSLLEIEAQVSPTPTGSTEHTRRSLWRRSK